MAYLLLALLLGIFGSSLGAPIAKESVEAKTEDITSWLDKIGTASPPPPPVIIPSATSDSAVRFAAAASSGALKPTVVVDCKGSGDAKTVKAGISLLVSKAKSVSKPVMYIKNCKYREKVEFPSSLSGAIIKGQSASGVSIEWGDTAKSAGSTFKSCTVAFKAAGMIVIDITFKNTAGYHSPSINNLQGVAVRVSADKVAFYGCSFYGYQDTLYDHQGRHYFKGCYIEGAIDFVFGNGQSIYESSTLYSPYQGSFTAQKRSAPGEKTGFVFKNCKILGDGLMRLARAWGEYSRTVFAYCYIDDTINKREPYSDFGFSNRRSKVFYGEYKNTGPGAVIRKRNTWTGTYILTDSQAAPFLSLGFIDGASWLKPAPAVTP
eukprot:TRINITY_DN22322_c0_g1_i1.p1 TRINITY_DN22322_c0_g1~~TRINITY_DN22322_c0_g1_i1.p1  ORF type:complete len:407 (+),score=60.37 TRINITY_DN22322_c0_g1_i1:93-1223(+)